MNLTIIFIMFYALIIHLVRKTISITEEVYEALLTVKRGNMTFSDVIMEMYNDLYGTVDEEDEDSSQV